MTELQTVVDENGTVHTLTRRLGAGGQGTVWLTRGERRVVKLFSGSRDREALQRRVAAVKILNLRELHVARPLALLRAPHVGYVAEFLSDMVPIRDLIAPPRGVPVASWYAGWGGLRRRLRLLAHAGEALSGLHARGLVYGDISHTNVFISGPEEAEEAWLIDLDNVRHDSDPAGVVYTLGYGAPELVDTSRGPTSLSDSWAFAVLAFQVLGLVHPFCGDWVTEGDPELEEQAFAGKLPWVDHAIDARNQSSAGVPREKIFSKYLSELARRTFEDGVHDRMKRPGIAAWVDRLHQAADQTVRCDGCDATYLAKFPQCTWCDRRRPPLVRVRIQRWEPGAGIVDAMGTVSTLPMTAEPLVLTRRHTRAHVGIRARTAEATLQLRERGLEIRTHGVEAWVTPLGAKDEAHALAIPPDRKKTLPLGPEGQGCVVHFEPLDRSHRVVVVEGGSR